MSDLIAWLRAQLDAREADARRRLADHTQYGPTELDPDDLLAEVDAKRAILDAYDKALRARQENAEKFAHLTRLGAPDQGEYTAVKTHGWTLDGRLDGLKAAIGLLAQPYAGRDGWQEEWRA